jgi:hypothetical protein
MRVAIALSLTALSVAMPAVAQDAPAGRPGTMLPSTREEAQTRARERFARLDRNGDGSVSADEMPARGGGGGAIARLDGNGDGKLSAAEFEARALGLFDRMDGDHDGRLSDEERRSWRARAGTAPAND